MRADRDDRRAQDPRRRPAQIPVPFGLDDVQHRRQATTTEVGGDRSSMALTPDGAIVMVKRDVPAFVMARFTTDRDLDTGFGDQGRSLRSSATSLPARNLGVAIQAAEDLMATPATTT
jgi:hypothetical protein